jgi:hypothetical protein
MLGSLTGTTLDSSTLLHGGVHGIAGFRAKLDRQGRMHLVTYDHLDKEPNRTDVRYLLVGPQP